MADEKFEPRRMPVHNDLATNTITEAIDTRRSIRVFTEEAVPPATIAQLLELSSRAPSGGNVQPWKVYVSHEPRFATQPVILFPERSTCAAGMAGAGADEEG